MKTHKTNEPELPSFPPRGWKKKVAEAAGCSEKTVYNALRGNTKGPKTNRVLNAYRKICSIQKLPKDIGEG